MARSISRFRPMKRGKRLEPHQIAFIERETSKDEQ